MFKPTLVSNNSQFHAVNKQPPIHERTANIIKNKQQRMLLLQQQINNESDDNRFHPTIGAISNELANMKRKADGEEDLVKRLADNRMAKRNRDIEVEQQRVSSICTFKPWICQKSQLISYGKKLQNHMGE